jgi:uncharacterized membrane protein YfcA
VEVAEVVGAVALGVAAGVVSGLLGVGGGVLFVPTLALVLGLGQLEAQSTSLLAIIPVALVGAWRQNRYGNLRVREGVVLGLLSPLGVGLGTLLANVVPERALEIGFAGLQFAFAIQLARRALEGPPDAGDAPGAAEAPREGRRAPEAAR